MNELKKTLEELKTITEDGHLTMYLIKRTSSSKPDKMRQIVLNVDLEGEIEEYFRNTINSRIELDLANDEIKIRDLFSRDSMPDDIFHLKDPSIVPTLPHIIEMINQSGNLESVNKFDEETLDRLYAYAIEISKGTDRIIYFRKQNAAKRMSAKGGTFIFRRGTFDKFRGQLFNFDKIVDTIYYENKNKSGMFIINTHSFETVFFFRKVYQEESDRAEEILKKAENVELAEGLFDDIKDKIRYIKPIALLNRRDEFAKLDFDRIRINKDKADGLRFQIEDDKIIINDKAALKDFLDVCERNIVQDPADTDQMYRARYKQEL
jgi:hypothetical protein